MIGPDSGENKEDLFHSAFMQSGAAIPVGDIREGQVRSFVLTVYGNHTTFNSPRNITISSWRKLVVMSPETTPLWIAFETLITHVLKLQLTRVLAPPTMRSLGLFFDGCELMLIYFSVIKACLGTSRRWWFSQGWSSTTCKRWYGCKSAVCIWYVLISRNCFFSLTDYLCLQVVPMMKALCLLSLPDST